MPIEWSTIARSLSRLAVIPLTQRSASVRQPLLQVIDALEQAVRDDRLERVQLQLACFCRETHGHVVADHLERDLVDDLGNPAVDLARHDARPRIAGRLISPSPARGPLDSRRKSLQVLDSLTATRFSAGDLDERPAILRRFDQVGRCDERYAR